MSSSVRIDELRLRASGLTREQGKRLGEIVAERLAKQTLVGDQQSRIIPSLNVRVQSNAGSSVERMAFEIAGSIRRSFR